MSAPILHVYDLDAMSYALRLTASCLGVALELRSVDVFPGRAHLSPAFLALNPLGRVPVLQDGDLTLTQPLAMVLHLADAHAPGHPLRPLSGSAHVAMMEWLAFATGDLTVAAEARAVAMLGTAGDADALGARTRDRLRLLDDHMTHQELMGRGYLAGAAPTLADTMAFPAFALSRDSGIDHAEFPALRLWARRIRRLPGFITMPGIPDYA